MNKLGEVMLEVSEEWFADLPAPEEVPAYTYSKKYLKWEQEVIYGKKHVALKRVAKVLLVAAILIIMLAVIALSTTKGREYIMQFFKEEATYATNATQSERVNSLIADYLPDECKLDYQFDSKELLAYRYTMGEKWFEIQKHYVESSTLFNYNENNYETIKKDGITYIISFVDNNVCNILWNSNNYYYQVSGTIDRNELLKIAFNVN